MLDVLGLSVAKAVLLAELNETFVHRLGSRGVTIAIGRKHGHSNPNCLELGAIRLAASMG